ncbi:hypothetical protein K8S19_01250 [bacterium]|nr:hypothetical protein [bacterium]
MNKHLLLIFLSLAFIIGTSNVWGAYTEKEQAQIDAAYKSLEGQSEKLKMMDLKSLLVVADVQVLLYRIRDVD